MFREKGEEKGEATAKPMVYREGRLYFTRRMERRIFFGLTLLMLAWGVLVRLGILS